MIPKEWLEKKPSYRHRSTFLQELKETEEDSDKEKFLEELSKIVINPHFEKRVDIYKYLKDSGLLLTTNYGTPISYPRFQHYFILAREKAGLSKIRGTKNKFIEDNYLTCSVEAIAEHIGSKVIYVKQTIHKIKKKLKEHENESSPN